MRVRVPLSAPKQYNPNQIFPVGDGFGLFVYFEKFEDTHFRNGVIKHPTSKPGGQEKRNNAQQSHRLFEIFGSIALAEVFAVNEDGDAYLQNAVIDATVIKVGRFLHDHYRYIGDDHGLAGEQSTVDYIENSLLASASVSLRTQVIQNE